MKGIYKNMPFIIQTARKYRYKLFEGKKYKTTRHYQSIEPLINDLYLTEMINLQKNRGFNKAEARYLLQTRSNNKWDKPILTGLFNTKWKNIYFGDIDKKKHFVIFVFPDKDKEVIIYVFPNYYPYTAIERKKLLKEIIKLSL